MCPITFQEAYDQTNPSAAPEARKNSARAIMAGVAANDAYWQSTDELTKLKAGYKGHGVVTVDRSEDADPSGQVTGSGNTPAITNGGERPEESSDAKVTDAEVVSEPPADDVSAEDKLRQQLINAGLKPDA